MVSHVSNHTGELDMVAHVSNHTRELEAGHRGGLSQKTPSYKDLVSK